MLIVETSNTGGEWSCRINEYREMTKVFYNGDEITERVNRNPKLYDLIWAFFNDAQDLDYALATWYHLCDGCLEEN
jgi:hypothetical protein